MPKYPAKRTLHDPGPGCGLVQQVVQKRNANPKPQPWIALKFAVGLACAIIGFASYVYVGRICVPMILRREDALGGRAMGVVFLMVFSILLLMSLWAYIKVLVTSPGFAKDHIPKMPPPVFPTVTIPRPSGTEQTHDIGTSAYESQPYHPPTLTPPQPTHQPTHQWSLESLRGARDRDASSRSFRLASHGSLPSAHEDGSEAVVVDIAPPPPQPPRRHSKGNANADFPAIFTRTPPTTPVLRPEHRYCYRCERVKPYRAHHCRACATCVLRYDHHCPWIGQCVGARNYKFFFNFVQWEFLFCIWIFSTTIGLATRPGSKFGKDFDPQKVAVIALSGLFSIFTSAIGVTHITLMCLNQTTVESLNVSDMKGRESEALQRMVPCYKFLEKARTKKRWDAEWGRIGMEGNIWWLGSARRNWESVMGKNVWWWFLPIGRSESDGLSYPVNPRFDQEGRWLPRREWPAELR